jgi:hypothetical protein
VEFFLAIFGGVVLSLLVLNFFLSGRRGGSVPQPTAPPIAPLSPYRAETAALLEEILRGKEPHRCGVKESVRALHRAEALVRKRHDEAEVQHFREETLSNLERSHTESGDPLFLRMANAYRASLEDTAEGAQEPGKRRGEAPRG